MMRNMLKPPVVKKARKVSAKANKKPVKLAQGGGVKVRGAGAATQGHHARGPMG